MNIFGRLLCWLIGHTWSRWSRRRPLHRSTWVFIQYGRCHRCGAPRKKYSMRHRREAA